MLMAANFLVRPGAAGWASRGAPIGAALLETAPPVIYEGVTHKGGGSFKRGSRSAAALLAQAAGAAPVSAQGSLIIPVAGVSRSQLTDTWGQARSQGRVHQGIDIMAAQSTPVIAAADGRIAKFFDSARGGITIYEFDTSVRFVYYYAHLSGRAPGLAEGDAVRQGEVIGFVGMTGNAPVPHLHFEVEQLGAQKHWWQGEAMNPYPLLMAGRAPSH
jgi:murein DD-endopeptidase MepM/ murein hydrolase activator NlpD